VNVSRKAKYANINLEGLTISPDGVIVTLKSKGLYDFNSLSDPEHIFPNGRQMAISGKKISQYLDPISVNVLILSIKK
jgi:alpha-L-arabinofuranosidase